MRKPAESSEYRRGAHSERLCPQDRRAGALMPVSRTATVTLRPVTGRPPFFAAKVAVGRDTLNPGGVEIRIGVERQRAVAVDRADRRQIAKRR